MTGVVGHLELTWVCVAALFGLLVMERLQNEVGRRVLKSVASLAFVGTAVSQGLPEEHHAWFILVGLALSVVGDVCLLTTQHGRAFTTGIGAFFLAHLAYIGAFVLRGLDWTVAAGACLLMVPLARKTYRWLSTSLPEGLHRPVQAYLAVISLMVASAAAAWGGNHSMTWALPTALLFLISDVGVAMHRFKAPHFSIKAWALPTYYAAQISFALEVATNH